MNLKVKEKDINHYDEIFEEKDYSAREKGAQAATDKFYTLITKFYEKGWGQSFHLHRDMMEKVSKPVSCVMSII